MRMNIPLIYTLDYFENLVREESAAAGLQHAVWHLLVFRDFTDGLLSKAGISMHSQLESRDIFEVGKPQVLDIIKEIHVGTNLLSNIRVHSPENIYGAVYAAENDLDDVILLNPAKRIARCTAGNLLFLEGNTVKVPKQSEGAYISPLLENFVTFVHKHNLAEILESEMIAFESQKADEILIISDEKGFIPVASIRNKSFGFEKYGQMLEAWCGSFS